MARCFIFQLCTIAVLPVGPSRLRTEAGSEPRSLGPSNPEPVTSHTSGCGRSPSCQCFCDLPPSSWSSKLSSLAPRASPANAATTTRKSTGQLFWKPHSDPARQMPSAPAFHREMEVREGYRHIPSRHVVMKPGLYKGHLTQEPDL